jgi:hypothetical protein
MPPSPYTGRKNGPIPSTGMAYLNKCQNIDGILTSCPVAMAISAIMAQITIGPMARSRLKHLPSLLNCSLHSYAFFMGIRSDIEFFDRYSQFPDRETSGCV